jgi:hypothetical protein
LSLVSANRFILASDSVSLIKDLGEIITRPYTSRLKEAEAIWKESFILIKTKLNALCRFHEKLCIADIFVVVLLCVLCTNCIKGTHDEEVMSIRPSVLVFRL